MVAVKVDPPPGRLETETVPPSNSASFRERGRPRPVPWTRRWAGPETWANSSKIRPRSSGGDPDPGVGDLELNPIARVGPGRDPDLTLFGELQGVGDEVAEDLRDLPLVGLEGLDRRRLVEGQRDRRGGVDQRPEHPPEGGEEVGRLERFGVDIDPARLHLGQVEQVIHHLREVLGRLEDVAGLAILRTPLLRRQPPMLIMLTIVPRTGGFGRRSRPGDGTGIDAAWSGW